MTAEHLQGNHHDRVGVQHEDAADDGSFQAPSQSRFACGPALPGELIVTAGTEPFGSCGIGSQERQVFDHVVASFKAVRCEV